MSGGHDSRPGLPAKPREIQSVLRAVSRIAGAITGDDPDPGTVDPDHGRMLLGLVAGFEGTVFPVPTDPAASLGYRVARSLACGGSPWL